MGGMEPKKFSAVMINDSVASPQLEKFQNDNKRGITKRQLRPVVVFFLLFSQSTHCLRLYPAAAKMIQLEQAAIIWNSWKHIIVLTSYTS